MISVIGTSPLSKSGRHPDDDFYTAINNEKGCKKCGHDAWRIFNLRLSTASPNRSLTEGYHEDIIVSKGYGGSMNV